MNMNPIRSKLEKMFGRAKKNSLPHNYKTNHTSNFESPAPKDALYDFSEMSTIKKNLSFCIEHKNFQQAHQ